MNCLFSSPMYTGCKSPQRRAIAGDMVIKDEKYWIPLICLFTGARINEVGQLLLSDIKQDNGIYYFDITNADESQSLKASSSKRCVPIHNELIKAGLIEYIKWLHSKKETKLFPALTVKASKETQSAKVSNWLNNYFAVIGIKDDVNENETKSVHSFRHSFKTASRAARIEEEIRDVLTGHKNSSVGRTYGYCPIDLLQKEINKISYHGLEISHLYVVDLQEQAIAATPAIEIKASKNKADKTMSALTKIPVPKNAKDYLRLVDVFIRLGQAKFKDWKPYHIGYRKKEKWYELDLKPYFRKTTQESNRINSTQLKMILSNSNELEDFSKESEMYDIIHIELGKYLQSGKIEGITQDKEGQYYKPHSWKLDYTIEEILTSEITIDGSAWYALVEPESLTKMLQITIG